MILSHRIENNICIVTIVGDIDYAGRDELNKYVASLLEGVVIEGMLLNLEKVDYIVSSGIGWISFTYRNLDQLEIVLACCSLNPVNQKNFEMTGLNRIIKIYETEEEALKTMETLS